MAASRGRHPSAATKRRISEGVQKANRAMARQASARRSAARKRR